MHVSLIRYVFGSVRWFAVVQFYKRENSLAKCQFPSSEELLLGLFGICSLNFCPNECYIEFQDVSHAIFLCCIPSYSLNFCYFHDQSSIYPPIHVSITYLLSSLAFHFPNICSSLWKLPATRVDQQLAIVLFLFSKYSLSDYQYLIVHEYPCNRVIVSV